MTFVDALVVLRRHKLLAGYGVLIALVVAIFPSYHLDGMKLVGRSEPTYQSTAVVAVKPGAEQPTATTVAAPPSFGAEVLTPPGVSTTTTAPPTTVPTPPLAPLNDVIDSRGLYYTALSLKTVILSPGFAEAVGARAPNMDGGVSAVVAQDTNTIDIVVDGSTSAIAAETMSATLAELQEVVVAYASTPAARFALDGIVVSAPSTPRTSKSIKDPLTFVLVLVVALTILWFIIRAADAIRIRRRRRTAVAGRALSLSMPSPALDDAGNGHHDTDPDSVPAR